MARSDDDEDSNQSEVGCCTKYTIFVFNVLFFFVGFAMVAMGTYCQVDSGAIYKKMQNSSSLAIDPTLFLILIGIVIFIIGFCGCLGSLRENTILLTIYTYSLIFILVVELLIGIGMYFYKDNAMEMIGNMLTGMIPVYKENEDLQEIMDQVQTSMKCCGIKGADDWDANEYFKKSDKEEESTPDSGGVPYSCCVTPYIVDDGKEKANIVCGRQSRKEGLSDVIYQVGCLHAIDEFTKTNGQMVLIVLVVVLAIQGVAIILAQNLKADIKAQRAKWLE